MLSIIRVKEIVEIFEEKLDWLTKDKEMRTILARDLIARIGLDNIELDIQNSFIEIREITINLCKLRIEDNNPSIVPLDSDRTQLLKKNVALLAEKGIINDGDTALFVSFENTYYVYSNDVLLECNTTLQEMYLHKIEDIVNEYDQAHKELGDFVNNLWPVQKLYIDAMCLWPYYKTKKDLSYLEYLIELSSTEVLDIFHPPTLGKRYYMLWEIFACNSGIRDGLKLKD